MNLDDFITRLQDFPRKIADECKDIMVEETPVGPTGQLRKSIDVLERTNEYCVVGTKLEYAEHVENGRGPVPSEAKRKSAKDSGKPIILHYFGYTPGEKSQHRSDDAGVEYFRTSVKAAKANPFAKRTVKALNAKNWHAVLMRH